MNDQVMVTYEPAHVEQDNRRVPVEEEPILIPVTSQSNSEQNVFQNNIIQEELVHADTSQEETVKVTQLETNVSPKAQIATN